MTKPAKRKGYTAKTPLPLKPCPCCGAQAETRVWGIDSACQIVCTGCLLSTTIGREHVVAALWNRRAKA